MNGRIVRLASAWMFCIILAGCEGDSGNDTSSAADVPDASAPDGTLSDTAPDDTLPDTTAADVPAETGADTPLPDGTNDTPPGDEGLPGDAVVDGFVEDVASPDPGTADTGLPDLPPDEGQPDVIDLPCAGIGPLEWSAEAILSLNWQAAVTACESLGEGWRMPDICEMRSAIVGCPATQAPGACGISYECTDFCDGDCTGCQLGAGPGTDGCYLPADWPGPCAYYWTSTPHGSWAGKAWMISSERAFPFASDKTGKANVRCVR